MSEPDLFSYLAYPNQPGARRTKTSRAAAKSVAPKVPRLRDRVLAVLKQTPMTPDECAGRLGESVLAIRPRVTELKKLGLIVDTGQTRLNASKLKASVFKVLET
jgi:predicted HTH transcriptional regulator